MAALITVRLWMVRGGQSQPILLRSCLVPRPSLILQSALISLSPLIPSVRLIPQRGLELRRGEMFVLKLFA